MVSPEARIREAAEHLRSGGLVAFPTETVYGLGASALDDRAIARIFEAKERPRFNPLIVHVPDVEAAAAHVLLDERAHRLAAAFWPGPLTLVLPRRAGCRLSHLVSAGLDTVAIRVPAHPLALELLRASGLPLAAPSANRSGTISPTLAEHVHASLGDRVDRVLDGGPCAFGLESTVLDLSTPVATILRPGALGPEDLEAVLGTPVEVSAGHADGDAEASGAGLRSPGCLLRHYAPRTPVRLNADPGSLTAGEVLLGFGPVKGAALNLSPRGDLREAAANLFAALHALDTLGATGIAVSPVPAEGLGVAINDRLRRAATPP
nr:L-threonylcarbamoyladenylate synthase [Phaeovibrio sulfidiphilus]